MFRPAPRKSNFTGSCSNIAEAYISLPVVSKTPAGTFVARAAFPLLDRGGHLSHELEDGFRTNIDVGKPASEPALAESAASGCVLQSLTDDILELGMFRQATAASSRHDTLGPEGN
jgi:hypothetical protein